MTPLAFSVVMPLFNKEGLVRRAVRSVLGQTVRDLELIVVDDGSTDRSRSEAEDAAGGDPRLRVLAQGHAGVSVARNTGVDATRARVVAFCDADDEWLPDHLEALAGLAARHPRAAVFATGYFRATGDGTRRAIILRGLPDGFEEGLLEDYFAVAAVSDPPIHTSSVAVEADALRAAGCFPRGVDTGEDLITWARLAAAVPVAYLRRPTAVFHAPAGIGERPDRAPAVVDLVGEELERLRRSAPARLRPGLDAYAGLWHRMRGIILLKLGRRREARSEFAMAMRVGSGSARLLALWAASVVPGSGRLVEPLQRFRERARGSAAATAGGA